MEPGRLRLYVNSTYNWIFQKNRALTPLMLVNGPRLSAKTMAAINALCRESPHLLDTVGQPTMEEQMAAAALTFFDADGRPNEITLSSWLEHYSDPKPPILTREMAVAEGLRLNTRPLQESPAIRPVAMESRFESPPISPLEPTPLNIASELPKKLPPQEWIFRRSMSRRCHPYTNSRCAKLPPQKFYPIWEEFSGKTHEKLKPLAEELAACEKGHSALDAGSKKDSDFRSELDTIRSPTQNYMEARFSPTKLETRKIMMVPASQLREIKPMMPPSELREIKAMMANSRIPVSCVRETSVESTQQSGAPLEVVHTRLELGDNLSSLSSKGDVSSMNGAALSFVPNVAVDV
jgi:hypothetical protein